jgi:MFS family permease
VGKGLRGPPRDAMVAAAAPPEMRGHAFGFHRMMDNAGAVLGSLLGLALLRSAALDLRTIFKLAVIPGLAAVLVALLFVREPPPLTAPAGKVRPTLAPGAALPPEARRYLLAVGVYALASSGDMFLILRLLDLGLPQWLVPVAWMSLQLGKALLNVPGGKAADRYGRRPLLLGAWTLYALTYAALGAVGTWPAAWALLGLYAVHYGLAEGGQRALLAELVPQASLGRAFGLLLAVEGIMVLPANVLFGFAYAHFGARVAFGAAGALACAGACLLATVRPRAG